MGVKWPAEIVIHTDGASRGNPGPASLGLVVLDGKGKTLYEEGRLLGIQTNNFAEYSAVLRALQVASENKVKSVVLKTDSELLVRQLKGEYKIKSENLAALYSQCVELVHKFKKVQFEHVRREYNKRADELANLALDGKQVGSTQEAPMEHDPKIARHMTKYPVLTRESTRVSEALQLMREHGIRHLPIEKDGKITGVVSERDLKHAESFKGPGELEVSDVMREEPFTVKAGTPLAKVAQQMAENKYGCAVVVNDKNHVVGIFTTTDGMRILAEILRQSPQLEHMYQIERYLGGRSPIV